MTITSLSFLAFVFVGVTVYYLLPKSWQWVELLVLSIGFYILAATPYTIAYLLLSTLTAYASTMYLARRRGDGKKKKSRMPLLVTLLALGINVLLWFVLKGRGLWLPIGSRLAAYLNIPLLSRLMKAELIGALGMGYYTLQVIGYLLDCYWGNAEPQKNPLKLFLFVCYFPQLTTGPISRYGNLQPLYSGHKFKLENLTAGTQRILWGFVKKLVLAERVGILVSAIMRNPECTGFYSWIAILLYPIQMYADFSGCMDIVLGVSELFDIRLAENFNNPFLARTSQEFWQRWHITLGTWAKDYVLYPLLKSKPMVKFGKFSRKKLGKPTGKFLTTALGMLGLWLVMGIWHGGIQYIAGVSLWYWVILMGAELLAPTFQRVSRALGTKTDSFSRHLFQSTRVYVTYAIGAVFFCYGISDGLSLLKDAGSVFFGGTANPWIFFDGSVLELGITYVDINIMLLCVGLLLTVGVLREKHGYARTWVAQQGVVFRWSLWILLFLLVVIYGKYGPGYSAAEFIYQGF